MHRKKHKKHMHLMIIFFSISWLACIVFALLFVRVSIENMQYKHLADIMKDRLISLKNETAEFQQVSFDKNRRENEAINYMQWQFVLKDQADQAKNRLQDEIKSIKGLKKDKQLTGLLYYNLGLANTLALNFGAAIDNFKNATDINPKDADSLYNLGLLHSTFTRDYKAAVKYYKMYLKVVPSANKAEKVKDRINQLQVVKQ